MVFSFVLLFRFRVVLQFPDVLIAVICTSTTQFHHLNHLTGHLAALGRASDRGRLQIGLLCTVGGRTREGGARRDVAACAGCNHVLLNCGDPRIRRVIANLVVNAGAFAGRDMPLWSNAPGVAGDAR